MSLSNRIKLTLLILIFLLMPVSAQAQTGVYCYLHRINDIAWSPDGELLAVMTIHGVVIYDADLNVIRSIEAPVVIPDRTSSTGLVWSPDSQWMILPDHSTPEIAAQGLDGWTIANAQTGELRSIISPFPVGERSTVSELVWRPDNAFIVALKYEPAFGLQAPRTTLVMIAGAFDGGFSPISQQFDDVHFTNLRWEADGITVHQNGLRLYLSESLELTDRAPVIYPRWWIQNNAGTLEAGQPQFELLVREIAGDARSIEIDPVLDSAGQFVSPGFVSEIIWINDDEHFLAIYPMASGYRLEEQPELARNLQGVLVDALAGNQEAGFLIQAEGDISGYSVSGRGDRIALYRDETWLELWNPVTGERLNAIEVPVLPIMDTC